MEMNINLPSHLLDSWLAYVQAINVAIRIYRYILCIWICKPVNNEFPHDTIIEEIT